MHCTQPGEGERARVCYFPPLDHFPRELSHFPGKLDQLLNCRASLIRARIARAVLRLSISSELLCGERRRMNAQRMLSVFLQNEICIGVSVKGKSTF